MAAKQTRPKATAKPAARSTAPKTVAACEREMRKHERAFRAYMAARRIKNAALADDNEAGAARAQATMEEHRPGYTTYWRAYERARALRKEAS